jgi:hypothetical protein
MSNFSCCSFSLLYFNQPIKYNILNPSSFISGLYNLPEYLGEKNHYHTLDARADCRFNCRPCKLNSSQTPIMLIPGFALQCVDQYRYENV